ncbi:hypothetical protein LC593_26340 [Nostoc sp. CHAB 5844]|nr:hypothetical protein [Nostoc sp. CHAB 5844]
MRKSGQLCKSDCFFLMESKHGSNAKDKIFGFDGDDTLLGGNSQDYIVGGDGDDVIFGVWLKAM